MVNEELMAQGRRDFSHRRAHAVSRRAFTRDASAAIRVVAGSEQARHADCHVA